MYLYVCLPATYTKFHTYYLQYFIIANKLEVKETLFPCAPSVILQSTKIVPNKMLHIFCVCGHTYS